jgi:hypothetical protein
VTRQSPRRSVPVCEIVRSLRSPRFASNPRPAVEKLTRAASAEEAVANERTTATQAANHRTTPILSGGTHFRSG